MTLQEYARAVAEAVRDAYAEKRDDWSDSYLNRVIASVPPPEPQHHDAPTGPGPYLARLVDRLRFEEAERDPWQPALVTVTGDVFLCGSSMRWGPEAFDAWVPLPPPAPDMQALDCGDSACRFAKQKGGMRTNGGCRCFERAGFAASAVEAAHQMLPEIMRLRGNVQAQIDAAPTGYADRAFTDAEWATRYAEKCRERDAALIARDERAPFCEKHRADEQWRGLMDCLACATEELEARVYEFDSQLDAAVADCEQRCATQLADYISRAADDERVRIDAAVKAYRLDMHECEQIAGRALGYPRYADDQQNFPDATDADGVCVGEHVAPTIVAELAEKYRAAMSELERIVELVEVKRAKFNIGTRASLALSDVLDKIRARSGAKE